MKARQIHFARGNQKMPVDQVNNPVRQVGREVGAVVGAAIFSKAARDIDSRESLPQSELYVRRSLIVAQQDVETRLCLLDATIFESKRFTSEVALNSYHARFQWPQTLARKLLWQCDPGCPCETHRFGLPTGQYSARTEGKEERSDGSSAQRSYFAPRP